MEINDIDENVYHNYQYCPPWALSYFKGRKVSIVGKVSTKPNKHELLLEIDPQLNIQIKVEVKPYELRYLFYPEQMAELSRSQHYKQLQSYIFPERSVNKGSGYQNPQSDEWCFLDPQKNKDEGNAMECEPNTEPSRTINADYFTPQQFIEVRGQLISSDTLLLEEFTDFGQDFDLKQYNLTLGVMINNVEHMYY